MSVPINNKIDNTKNMYFCNYVLAKIGLISCCNHVALIKIQYTMQPLGTVLNKFLKSTKWKSRLDEIKIKNDWHLIVGKTIAKYTKKVSYYEGVLIIYTDIAPLKQEIMLSKTQLITTINEHFAESIVKDIQVR